MWEQFCQMTLLDSGPPALLSSTSMLSPGVPRQRPLNHCATKCGDARPCHINRPPSVCNYGHSLLCSRTHLSPPRQLLHSTIRLPAVPPVPLLSHCPPGQGTGSRTNQVPNTADPTGPTDQIMRSAHLLQLFVPLPFRLSGSVQQPSTGAFSSEHP